MDLYDIHKAIDFFFEKSQLGMLIPEDKDARIDQGQMLRFTELFDNPNEYGKGDSLGKMHYGKSQKIHDSLQPFKKTVTFTNGNFATGVYTLPNDYMHLLSMDINIADTNAPGDVTYQAVDFVKEDEWSERRKSQLIPATATRPIGRLIYTSSPARAVEMFPAQGYAGTLMYLRRPAKPVLDYTLGGASGREITYNSGASTQLEWDDAEVNNILFKTLQLCGVNLQSGEIVQYFQQKDATGV